MRAVIIRAASVLKFVINKTRVIPHPMRRIGWGWIAGRALARLQLYSIEYGSGAHFFHDSPPPNPNGCNCCRRCLRGFEITVFEMSQRVERIVVKPGHTHYLACHRLCSAARKLGNQAVYIQRQRIFAKGSSSKTPVAKPNGTKMFCSVFLNDVKKWCFFAIKIV